MFKGSIPALITPFAEGEIDWKAFDQFVEWQIDQGSHGLVPCGTTGESPTLSHDEHNQIVERCIDIVKQRLIKNFGYDEVSATDVLNFVASIFARGDVKE